MLVVRILPVEEWPRLAGTESAKFAECRAGQPVVPFVVEEEGRIVGTWTLTTYNVLEGLWVSAEQRGHNHVRAQRALLRAVREYALNVGLVEAVTFSASAQIDRMCDRVGGRVLGAVPWVLPLTKEAACLQQR